MAHNLLWVINFWDHLGEQAYLGPVLYQTIMKSYFNWNENTYDFVKALLDDESFHIVKRTRVNKNNYDLVDLIGWLMTNGCEQTNAQEQIMGMQVDWLLSDGLENQTKQMHDTSKRDSKD